MAKKKGVAAGVPAKGFEFARSAVGFVYPWDKWMDGQVWKLQAGKDFVIPNKNFIVFVHTKARKCGKRVKTQKETSGKNVFIYIQFSDIPKAAKKAAKKSSKKSAAVKVEAASAE